MNKCLLKWTVALTTGILTLNSAFAQNHRCGFDLKHENRLNLDPSYKNKVETIENDWIRYVEDENNPKKMIIDGTDTTYEIPIVVHIVHTGGSIGSIYNPNDYTIQQWVEYTNQVLAGTAPGYVGAGDGGTDLGIRLVLAKRTPECTYTNGILRVDGSVVPGYTANGVGDPGVDEDEIFALSRWNPSDYYNIYIVNKIDGNDGTSGSFTAGYAYLPPADPSYDGSVMLATIAESGESTFAHELGHALGLYHTFQGGTNYTTGGTCGSSETLTTCASLGDRVCDTEYSRGLLDHWVCPTNSDINPCTGTNYEGVQYNVMNYSTCPNRFTPGQRERAIYMLLTHRSSLVESNGTIAPPTSPITGVFSTCMPDTIANPTNSFAGGPTRVRLESIDNSSNPYRNYLFNFIEDFTQDMCMRDYTYTDLIKGETYSLLIDLFLNVQHMSVFIDFNGDGVFNTTNERVYLAYSSPGTTTVTFTVPNDVVEDTYVKMRIKSELSGGSATLPCGDLSYGQVEDYAVRFLVAPMNQNTNQLKAQTNQCAVQLDWSITDAKFAIETIELERSHDGKQYQSIEHYFIGKNQDIRSFQDLNPGLGENFYRLKIKNIADKVSYSQIAKVDHKCENGFTVFPNPTQGHLSLQYFAESDNIAYVDVYDMIGKNIKSIRFDAKKGLNLHEIDLSEFNQGIYMIKLTQNNQSTVTKVNLIK